MAHLLNKCVCRSCRAVLDGPTLELGALPALNKYTAFIQKSLRNEFVVTYCRSCGLMQQAYDISVEFLRPRVSWISYNEPDNHLDEYIRFVSRNINFNGQALGIGPFDRPILDRLASYDMDINCLELNKKDELGGYPYLETIQQNLTELSLKRAVGTKTKYDLISCRYLLEHCNAPIDSLKALARLLNKNGLLIIEVPDSSKFLAVHDYSFLWEEHTIYFIESSIRRMVENAGLKILELNRYEGKQEDAIILTLKVSQENETQITKVDREYFDNYDYYINSFDYHKEQYYQEMLALKKSGKKIALFGIGHQALMFTNALGLHDYIDYYLDDDPNKIGMYPAGLNSKIYSSSIIFEDHYDIGVCLFALNPRLVNNLINKVMLSERQELSFYSIFSSKCYGARLEEII